MVLWESDRARFDSAVSFYPLIHLPVEDQHHLISRISDWLLPNGYLMAIVGHEAWTGIGGLHGRADVLGSNRHCHVSALAHKRRADSSMASLRARGGVQTFTGAGNAPVNVVQSRSARSLNADWAGQLQKEFATRLGRPPKPEP